ncbi:unnamed protein product [Ectocarpus fasciculatus]
MGFLPRALKSTQDHNKTHANMTLTPHDKTRMAAVVPETTDSVYISGHQSMYVASPQHNNSSRHKLNTFGCWVCMTTTTATVPPHGHPTEGAKRTESKVLLHRRPTLSPGHFWGLGPAYKAGSRRRKHRKHPQTCSFSLVRSDHCPLPRGSPTHTEAFSTSAKKAKPRAAAAAAAAWAAWAAMHVQISYVWDRKAIPTFPPPPHSPSASLANARVYYLIHHSGYG